jgi:putative dimethyl sulfoxide reductase chaperone
VTVVADRAPSFTDVDVVDLTLQLTATLYVAPAAPLRDDLAEGAIVEAVAALAAASGVPAPAFVEPDWTTLQSSHVALFVSGWGGVAAPPYVGYAVDGELLGPTAEALAHLYRRHGIEIDPHWSDLPDHVAAVAEAGLLLLEADRRDAAKALLVEFLSPWFQRYAAAVAAADVSGFYGPLTEFLSSVTSEVVRETAA